MSELLHISSAPHDRGGLSTKAVMRDVLLALLPTTILGVWAHGWYSGLIILLSITAAVLTEYVFDRVTKRDNTVTDGSAILRGAPHEENARRFLDFTVSRDVQALVGQQFCRRTVRTDIPPDVALPALGSLAILPYDVEWASSQRERLLSEWAFLFGEVA